jgi:hypothetical protein
MACFGSPRYDKEPPLTILSADSRFPDLKVGKEGAAGNHFLCLEEAEREGKKGGGIKESQ